MSEPNAKVPAQEPVKPAPSDTLLEGMDAQSLRALIQLMLLERQDAMADRRAKREASQRKDEQRRINAEYMERDRNLREQSCTHLKGGRKGPKAAKIDYAVGYHTFINGRSYIRCFICGAKWKPNDTEEFMVRFGNKIPNHTGIGWKQALDMLKQSTNTATSSEVPLQAAPLGSQDTD